MRPAQRLIGRKTLDREFVENVVDDVLRAHSSAQELVFSPAVR